MPEKRTGSPGAGDAKPRDAAALGALQRGREHFARRAWAEAYESLSLADRSLPLGVKDLELLAWSAGLTGRDDEFLRNLERLYRAECDAGDSARAARWAFWSGFRLMALGEAARGSGWLARAQRLVEREGDASVVEGYLLLPAFHRRFAAGDYDAACDAAARAADIGDRFREADLIALARNLHGKGLLQRGQIEAGLALVDEAMLAATAGELSPIVTGLVYCGAIATCQRVYAFDRAREWTSALAAWCEAQPELVPFTGTCLVHRAEILQLGGAWGEAIEHARRASERCAPTSVPEAAAAAAYQQAEVHRLRGEFAAAEEAYRSASQLGREPQPGLSLLRLAEGRRDAAVSAIRRVVGEATDPLERTRLLPAFVEIMLAAFDLESARAACEDLEAISSSFGADVLGAMAAHARGAIQLAEGDAQGALAPLRRAFHVWREVGAPYIAARIRVAIARACRALGDEEGAALELKAAREVFERLGAAPDLAGLDALEKGAPPADRHGLTARELEVLRLVASGKTNKVIARELGLSEKTVDRHVSNIFAKVNVTSRAAATAYAYEHGLV